MTLKEELYQWKNRLRDSEYRNDARQADLLLRAIQRIEGAEELLQRNDVGNVDWWRQRDAFILENVQVN